MSISAIELTLATPLLIACTLLILAAGRLTYAFERVNESAHQAARAASTARAPTSATRAATSTAHAALAERGQSCQRIEVAVDTGHFRPGGQVTVQVTCTVALSDLTLQLPGTRAITMSFTAPIDQWRAVP